MKREKLIELLKKAQKKSNEVFHEQVMRSLKKKGRFNSRKDVDRRNLFEVEADFLLESGVIVPPCKVGDTVWTLTENNIPLECEITQILIDKLGTGLVYEPKAFRGRLYGVKSEAFGKTIFFTEGEAALKGGDNE